MTHADDPRKSHGALGDLARKIPGFKGYLAREDRRDADALEREWCAERLARSKRGIDALAEILVDAARMDDLPKLEKLRAELDRLIGRIKGAMKGYSGLMDADQIDEARLDDLYDHDLALVHRVDELAAKLTDLKKHENDVAAATSAAREVIQELHSSWDRREDMLRGTERDLLGPGA